jgi:phosphoenolpyruvate-protein kinase (PTS system EI component)
MDLGGDKIPRRSMTANETALHLGKRGLALSLAQPALFRTQIRAILRAARGGAARIMFPMVMGAADLLEAVRLVKELARLDPGTGCPAIGAMVETPAAVFDIRRILEHVDFVSIGTNDLSHTVLALDRMFQGDSEIASFLHPSVLRATAQIIREAAAHSTPLSVCGEAAGDPETACLLVGMGVRSLSMSPYRAATVRQAVARTTVARAAAVAKIALASSAAVEIRKIAAEAFHTTSAAPPAPLS